MYGLGTLLESSKNDIVQLILHTSLRSMFFRHFYPSLFRLFLLAPSSCFASSAARIEWNAAGFRQRQSLEGSCGPNGPMKSPTIHREV